MIIPDPPEKASRGSPRRGDPPAQFLERFAALLEAADSAYRVEHAAQVAVACGEPDAAGQRYAALWAAADAQGDVEGFKADAAAVVAMSLRWLAERFPDAFGPLRDLKGELAELRHRVADLEAVAAEGVPA